MRAAGLLLVGVVLVLLARPAGAQPANDLDALLARWAAMPGLEARFTEDKQLALLAAPLHSEGTIHFLKGRGVAVHTTVPSRQSTLVTARQLVLWDGHTVRRINLDASASLAAFAQAFSMLLGADRAGLERSFTVTLKGQVDEGWSLRLSPKGAPVRSVVAAIELEGKGPSIATLRILEGNGDVSTMHFTSVDTQRRYTDAEADRIFRVPPP